ncbi:MAG TPA: hypothetical protein VNJ52_12050 [Patescibacteria group bacterium]|nr:hypothetical protein [Patescibacteria group bacterium]
MRNALGVAIAAVFIGTVPASAQMRRALVAAHRTQPVLMPNRITTVSRFRQGQPAIRPGIRVVYLHPAAAASSPQRPVVDTNPSPSSSPSLTAASSLAFAGAGGTPIPLDQILNPIPGLGFDFTHLAAVNSGLAIRAFIDPVTEHELAVAESLPEQAPAGVGFFPTFGFDGAIPATVATSQPQVIVVQEPVLQPARAATPAAPPPAAAAAPPAPPLPVGELYLVRRDGGVIRAIAFSEQDGQIVYITKGGMRRSMALDELDIDATEERNAERGTILHLSE